ncbi:MAG: glycosyltransferase family 2 protein [Acidimicrobiales bacterium]|nr:glycosyltransferase family 2 protein [Acidimicrobiales bacterium]
MTSLSVVVPATNAPPTLGRCRAAIRAAQDPPEEVIVVEDAHLSASEARNAGVRRAQGDVVVFIDADVEVHPDAFSRIRSAFDDDPGLGALFGSYDDDPADPGVVSAFRNLLHHQVHQAGAGPAETFWTGLGAIRRQTFLRIGGFDADRYPHPSIEDIELGDRLRFDGSRSALDPTIQGKHLKTWTLRSMLWTDLARRAVPWVALQVRTRRRATTLNCGLRHQISAAVWVVAVVAAIGLWLPLLASCLGVLIIANRHFYGLLVRRMGLLPAIAGIGLHCLHHLVAVAAVPVGIVVALLDAPRPLPPLGAASISRVDGFE